MMKETIFRFPLLCLRSALALKTVSATELVVVILWCALFIQTKWPNIESIIADNGRRWSTTHSQFQCPPDVGCMPPLVVPLTNRAPLNSSLTGRNGRKSWCTPPRGRLFCRKRAPSIAFSKSATKKTFTRGRSESPPSPINMYVGANFSVRLRQWFHFEQLIKNNQLGGVVQTEFHSFRSVYWSGRKFEAHPQIRRL